MKYGGGQFSTRPSCNSLIDNRELWTHIAIVRFGFMLPILALFYGLTHVREFKLSFAVCQIWYVASFFGPTHSHDPLSVSCRSMTSALLSRSLSPSPV